MRPGKKPQNSQRARWLRLLHQWHWISSAISLCGILIFAVTGITLNHAGSIEASPTTARQKAALPADLRPLLAASDDAPPGKSEQALPPALGNWLDQQFAIRSQGRPAEWTADEIYLAMPRPGGDAWLSIDRASGEVEYENSRRGFIAWLNDLHKGRNTGALWSWFIDIFALACVVFSLTGFLLLKAHAERRRSTWPLIGGGLLLPALLAVFFIH